MAQPDKVNKALDALEADFREQGYTDEQLKQAMILIDLIREQPPENVFVVGNDDADTE
jgi:hypothetical protein